MSRINVPWSENIEFPGHHRTLEINADTYNDWVKKFIQELLPEAKLPKFPEWTKNAPVTMGSKRLQAIRRNMIPRYLLADLGDEWQFVVRILPYYSYGSVVFLETGPKRRRLQLFQDRYGCYEVGSCMFTGPVYVPMLLQKNTVWMSLTPMEIMTLRDPLRRVHGKVFVGGLGMGWLTRKILEQEDVVSVVQVEANPKVIEFFGAPIKKQYGDRIQFVEGDVYDYFEKNNPQQFDFILLDIWEKYAEAADDEQYLKLKNKYYTGFSKNNPGRRANIWAWGDCDHPCDDDELELDDEELYDDEEREFDNDLISINDKPWEWWGF